MKNNKHLSKLLHLGWSVAKTGLLSFVIYFFSVFIFAAIFENSDRTLLANFLVLSINAIAFWIVHASKSGLNYSLTLKDDYTFSFWKEVKAYVLDEGKYLLLIFAFLFVINELDMWVISPKNNPVSTAIYVISPFNFYFKIPVIGSVLSMTISLLLISILTILSRYLHYRKSTKQVIK